MLRAQERAARDKAMAEMKADGVDYDERMERLAEVTYPRPLEDLLAAAFERYCQEVPWARDFELSPKSVVRDMVETASDFKTYVQRYKIARSEGTLLRYLADAYRVLDRTVPPDRRDERLEDIVSWLGFLVRSVDSSLVDEWESAGSVTDAAPPACRRRRGCRPPRPHGARAQRAFRARAAGRPGTRRRAGEGSIRSGAAASRAGSGRSTRTTRRTRPCSSTPTHARRPTSPSTSPTSRPTTCGTSAKSSATPQGDHDFAIAADVDLDASQEEGEAVFKNYRVGFFEEL